MTATPDAAITVADLTVHYGDVLALDAAALRVADAAVTGLVGVNGSGKSTLFASILGSASTGARGSNAASATVAPGGEVRIRSLSPAEARRAGLVAYMPQSEGVDWNFPVSVRDVVMMGRYAKQGLTRRIRPADRAAVDGALERVGLTDLAGRQIGELSGGQRKRVFIARAMAQEATVLLLDEPFAGVDRSSEAAITTLLRSLAADGAAILVSTHDLASLSTLCDEVVLWYRRTIAHGAPAETLTPDNLALAFGSSR